MKEFSKVIGLVILLGALAGAVLLVQKIQETRRGATYGAVDVIILPTEKSVKTGEKLVVSVGFDAKEYKPSGVDLRFKYDQTRLRAVEVKPVILQTEGGLAFFQSIEDVLDTRIYQENGWVYLTGINMEENESKMVSVQTLALITFEVIGEGGVATMALDANYNNIIGGFKAEGGDLSLAINPSRVGKYTIASTGVTSVVKNTLTPSKTLTINCMWCGRDCLNKDPTRTYNCLDVMPPEGSVCVAENGKCVIKGDDISVKITPIISKVIPNKTLTPTKTMTISCMWCGRDCIVKDPTRTYNCLDVMPPEGSVCVAENGKCVVKGDGVIVPISTGKLTPTIVSGNKCQSCGNGANRSNGDANCNGGTDLTDFEFWRSEMFDQGGYLGTVKNDWRADFDCDGKVTVFDFEQWRRNRQ